MRRYVPYFSQPVEHVVGLDGTAASLEDIRIIRICKYKRWPVIGILDPGCDDPCHRFMDSGKVDSIADIQTLVAKAVIASKFFGKEMYFLTFPEEMTEEDKEWMKAQEEKRNAPKNA